MYRKITIGTTALLVWLLLAGNALAQTPRPTPTNEGTPGDGGDPGDEADPVGSISGFVYEDVNGDGRCVNSGTPGENPIQGIDVRFVSSDQQTVFTHYSGTNGDFGLYPAGQSYWEITIQPPAGWTVTTARTLYVPVYPESLNHGNVNFCLSRGPNAVIRVPGVGGTVILPESGASAAELARAQARVGYGVVVVTAVLGFSLLLTGYYLEHRRKKA